jgi:hypothetical protein
MKFLNQSGDFILLDISEWVKLNHSDASSYRIYSGENAIYDGSTIDKYYLKMNDVTSIIKTTQAYGNCLYIETVQGYTHEFIGALTHVGYLQAVLKYFISKHTPTKNTTLASSQF